MLNEERTSHSSCWITPETARSAIQQGTGCGIKIAIIDSGIELSHCELGRLKLVDDIGFAITDGGTLERTPGRGIDFNGHGTAVAATIKRIAPEALLGSFQALDHRLSAHSLTIKEAVFYAIERGYHIINCSFGAIASDDKIRYYKSWIDTAYQHGIHVVSACNNNNFRTPEWPGNFPTVITVNMADTQSDDLYFRWDMFALKSNSHLTEFAARGVGLDLPSINNGKEKRTGSSFAAPHVAGILARLLSVYPDLKPPVAKALLQEVALEWEPALRTFNG